MTLLFSNHVVDCRIRDLHIRSEEDFPVGSVSTSSNLEMTYRNTRLHFDLEEKCIRDREYSFDEQEENILNTEVSVTHECINLLLCVRKFDILKIDHIDNGNVLKAESPKLCQKGLLGDERCDSLCFFERSILLLPRLTEGF